MPAAASELPGSRSSSSTHQTPSRDGLVQTLSHPGGNLTGVFGARDPSPSRSRCTSRSCRAFIDCSPWSTRPTPGDAAPPDAEPRKAAAQQPRGHRAGHPERIGQDRLSPRPSRRSHPAGLWCVPPVAELSDSTSPRPLTTRRDRAGGSPDPGASQGVGHQWRALLARGRRWSCLGPAWCALRRRHPALARGARRPPGPGGAPGRVRAQPEARAAALGIQVPQDMLDRANVVVPVGGGISWGEVGPSPDAVLVTASSGGIPLLS